MFNLHTSLLNHPHNSPLHWKRKSTVSTLMKIHMIKKHTGLTSSVSLATAGPGCHCPCLRWRWPLFSVPTPFHCSSSPELDAVSWAHFHPWGADTRATTSSYLNVHKTMFVTWRNSDLFTSSAHHTAHPPVKKSECSGHGFSWNNLCKRGMLNLIIKIGIIPRCCRKRKKSGMPNME